MKTLGIACTVVAGLLSLAWTDLASANPAPLSQRLDLTNATNGTWKVAEIKEAPEVPFLVGGQGETAPIPFTATAPGAHRVWLKLRTDKDKVANLLVVVRAPNGEVVRVERIDAPIHNLPPAQPYLERKIVREAGPLWQAFDVTLEYPGVYALTLGGAVGREGGRKLVERAYVSNELAFDPVKQPEIALALSSSSSPPPPSAAVPEGFLSAPVHPLQTSLYTGIAETDRQFKAGLIQNGSICWDPAAMVLLGVNRDQGWRQTDPSYGILTMAGAAGLLNVTRAFIQGHASPTGRFVNAEGTVGSMFSLAYEPARLNARTNNQARIVPQLDLPNIETWCVAGEAGGWLDYSPWSAEAFRAWLTRKYGTITKLNAAWRADYPDFAAIEPARSAAAHKANWLEFREFCGTQFAEGIAESVAIVNKADPKKRQATAQFSNLDFMTVKWSASRPVDLEELILTGMKDADNYAWDSYCADDYVGAEVDLVDSLGNGKKMIQREFNTHTPNTRIAARTYWTMVGKGIRGIALFQFQEGAGHDSYPKWALTHGDLSPRPKLAAFSDCMQEVHRIENILVDAKKRYPAKPVAIYYSRVDQSLQVRPLASTWGEGIDSPYRVYELLRGRGYPVTFITPKQIEAGKLDAVGAVVFVDAQHISTAACDKIIAWVKGGGAVIGDTWPGAHDALGNRQDALMNLFGVEPAERKRVDKIKLDESPQGYGEVTVAAINPDALHDTIMETWQQWDATHPVAKKLGNWMFAGYGAQRIRCIAGEVIGMVFDGHPGVVVNQTGRGHSLYVSTMLGSLYGSSATSYEWDTAHSDLSPARLLDAFLEFAGVRRLAAVDLPETMAFKVRVEAPLVDRAGNAIIGLASYNDDVLRPFGLRIAWPTGLAAPRKLYAAVGGSRNLQEVPFTYREGQIELTMPTFDSHATLIAVRQTAPLVALDFGAAPRDAAGLTTLKPGQSATVAVTVHNTTGKKLDGGALTLRLPEGWFCDTPTREVPPIAAWETGSAAFRIQGPAFCAATRVRPISVLYASGKTRSMPCTEAVWWSNP